MLHPVTHVLSHAWSFGIRFRTTTARCLGRWCSLERHGAPCFGRAANNRGWYVKYAVQICSARGIMGLLGTGLRHRCAVEFYRSEPDGGKCIEAEASQLGGASRKTPARASRQVLCTPSCACEVVDLLIQACDVSNMRSSFSSRGRARLIVLDSAL